MKLLLFALFTTSFVFRLAFSGSSVASSDSEEDCAAQSDSEAQSSEIDDDFEGWKICFFCSISNEL